VAKSIPVAGRPTGVSESERIRRLTGGGREIVDSRNIKLNIVIDTSHVAADTVQDVASDPSGLTATSTRTVLIDPAPPLTPDYPATTTLPSTAASPTAP
jgi:hypothetical protein